MRERLIAVGCIPRPSSTHVWISDALLTETFNRFSHRRRHGSNVPGPLEAQRRAPKRKNTVLAAASPGGVSIDPSILLGSSASKSGWWGERKPAGEGSPLDALSQLLPHWLNSPTTIPQEPEPESKPQPTDLETTQSATSMEWLYQCRTLQDIKRHIQDRGIDLRHESEMGAAILRSILDRKQINLPAADVAAYICDPAFHPPGSSYILDLVRALDRFWKPESWHLHQSICSAIELGLVSIRDVRSIINEALEVRFLGLRPKQGISRLPTMIDETRLRLVADIVESLGQSRVLQVADLGPSILSKVFTRFGRLLDSAWCETAMWRLLPWVKRHQLRLVTQLVLRYLSSLRFLEIKDKGRLALVDRLMSAEPELLQLVLAHTTELLFDRAAEKKPGTYRRKLRCWGHVLAVLGSPKHEVTLTKDTWELLLSTKSTLSADQRIFAFAWSAMALCHDFKTSNRLVDRLQGLDRFEKMVGFLPRLCVAAPRQGVIGNNVLTLPHKDVFWSNLDRLSFYKEQTPSPPKAVPLWKSISPSIIARGTLNRHNGRSGLLQPLLETSTHGFPAFKALSRRLIHKNPDSFGMVCNFLESDLRFHRALRVSPIVRRHGHGSQLGNPISEYVDADRAMISTASPELGSVALGQLSARVAVDLLRHLAISFATSPVAGARSALRRVFWCYRFLKYHDTPIEATISKSLWHAGVARYGEGGTPRAQMEWVLGVVRMVEGDSVADRLIMDSIFRRLRAVEIHESARVSEEEEQAVLAMLRGDDFAFGMQDGTSLGSATSNHQVRTRDLASSPPLRFSPTEIAALYTGDEVMDREMQEKIIFLQSEPPFEPFKAMARSSRRYGADVSSDNEDDPSALLYKPMWAAPHQIKSLRPGLYPWHRRVPLPASTLAPSNARRSKGKRK